MRRALSCRQIFSARFPRPSVDGHVGVVVWHFCDMNLSRGMQEIHARGNASVGRDSSVFFRPADP